MESKSEREYWDEEQRKLDLELQDPTILALHEERDDLIRQIGYLNSDLNRLLYDQSKYTHAFWHLEYDDHRTAILASMPDVNLDLTHRPMTSSATPIAEEVKILRDFVKKYNDELIKVLAEFNAWRTALHTQHKFK